MCSAMWLARQELITSGRGNVFVLLEIMRNLSCYNHFGNPKKASPDVLKSSWEQTLRSKVYKTETQLQQVYTPVVVFISLISHIWLVYWCRYNSAILTCLGNQSLAWGKLYPCLLLEANSLHCPAYHQLGQWRWQACERGQEETKAAVKDTGGHSGPTLIFVLWQRPIMVHETSRHWTAL